MPDLFACLDRLVDDEDIVGVERLALRALRKDDDPEVWRYVAWARLELGRYEAALEAAGKAEDPVFEAEAHFGLWQFDEAERLLECIEGEAEVEWYRGLLAEFRGEDPTAHFKKAAELAPDAYAEPVRLSDAEIDTVIESALASLPRAVAGAVADAVVELKDLPDPHPDVDPLSLGLYVGSSLLERSVDDSGRLPAKIEIYRRNIERIALDRDHAVEELSTTLLHELGHHLGYDEDGLERLDLA